MAGPISAIAFLCEKDSFIGQSPGTFLIHGNLPISTVLIGREHRCRQEMEGLTA